MQDLIPEETKKECLGCQRKVDELKPVSVRSETAVMLAYRCADCIYILTRVVCPWAVVEPVEEGSHER